MIEMMNDGESIFQLNMYSPKLFLLWNYPFINLKIITFKYLSLQLPRLKISRAFLQFLKL